MLVGQMWQDPRLNRICDIEADQQPCGIAVLSRVRSKSGSRNTFKNSVECEDSAKLHVPFFSAFSFFNR